MSLESKLSDLVREAIQHLYQLDVSEVVFQVTRKEFEGSHTLVVFPYTKASKLSPEATGTALGNYLIEKGSLVSKFNVVKGFLNLSISERYWIQNLQAICDNKSLGLLPSKNQKVMVEYSSPNTNKPLHLGHLRNNFLGYAVAEILKASGYEVVKANLVNDRGIHICKSMLAYQKYGQQETPESAKLKGDHLVGKYYVEFDKKLKAETSPLLQEIYEGKSLDILSAQEQTKLQAHLQKIETLTTLLQKETQNANIAALEKSIPSLTQHWQAALQGQAKWKDVAKNIENDTAIEVADNEQAIKDLRKTLKPITALEEKIDVEKDEIKDIAQNKTPLMQEVKAMLLKWEQNDPETVALWKQMNTWVYEGFNATYTKMGVDFDKFYYESNTYLLGKDIVDEGLAKGVFFKKEDGSVWIDLTAEGLDNKLVLRGDGTSVYITQDMGTADLKYKEHGVDKSIYVVGNEQDYHFVVLKHIMKKLQRPYADEIHHLSYGMVDLPSGKMKSREGTVVDADDLMQETITECAAYTKDSGKIDDIPQQEAEQLYTTLGMGALKYYLLKVDPKKRMLFNPQESIDLHGHTGPYIQYTHARIKSVLRKAQELNLKPTFNVESVEVSERELAILLSSFGTKINEAAHELAPSVIANYVYELAKLYNTFYNELSILKEADIQKVGFRIGLCTATANTIKSGMKMLGIDVPERM